MRKEKKDIWDGEISHVYTWDTLDHMVEVNQDGLVKVRNKEGKITQYEHLLDLIDINKLNIPIYPGGRAKEPNPRGDRVK